MKKVIFYTLAIYLFLFPLSSFGQTVYKYQSVGNQTNADLYSLLQSLLSRLNELQEQLKATKVNINESTTTNSTPLDILNKKFNSTVSFSKEDLVDNGTDTITIKVITRNTNGSVADKASVLMKAYLNGDVFQEITKYSDENGEILFFTKPINKIFGEMSSCSSPVQQPNISISFFDDSGKFFSKVIPIVRDSLRDFAPKPQTKLFDEFHNEIKPTPGTVSPNTCA